MLSSRSSLVAAAEAIAPQLVANARISESERMVAPQSVRAMAEAGLWGVLTPKTHDGAEAGLRAQVDTLLVTAAADSAAGWVQMVSNAHCWMVGSWPKPCQGEVFAAGSQVRVPGTLAPQGRATRTEGGWHLDGRWQFASGVDHGDWLMFGAIADENPYDSPDPGLHVIVPKDDVVVDDTWFTLGLRGTGSKDLVAERVFVPDHRAMATRPLFEGFSPHGEDHATHFNRVPVVTCLSTQLAGAVVGIARGALALHIERTAERGDIYTGQRKAENAAVQMRIAESAVELDAATMLVREAADRADRVGETGDRLATDERAKLKWHVTYAVELARRAVDRIFAGSGAHGVYDTAPLQGRYRDVNTACHHAIVDVDGSAQMYGRNLLGVPGIAIL